MATEEAEQDVGEAETDVNVMLIHLVQEYPFIYDADDPQYKDRYLIEGTWSVIASQVNLTVEEAKTKWQRLRNNFSKACYRRVKTPLNRSAATKLQKPWIYEAEMEFMRSHLHHHRAPSFSLKRPAQEAEGFQHSMSPQSGTSDASDSEQISDAALMSDNFSPWTVIKRESHHETSQSPKTRRKQDQNDRDSAASSSASTKESPATTTKNKTKSKKEKDEDPAVGWFKSLLPMFNTLSPIEKLEFQSKVTLELRSFLVAKDNREQQADDQDQSIM